MNLKSVIGFVLTVALSSTALAHSPGLSTLKLQQQATNLNVELIFSPEDLQQLIALDENSDGKISTNEISRAEPFLEQMANTLLLISVDDKALTLNERKYSQDENDNFRFDLEYNLGSGTLLKVVSQWIVSLPAGHRQFVSFGDASGLILVEDLLDSANIKFSVDLIPQTATIPPQKVSLAKYFGLGVHHILTGYDHLLFLFALLIVCESFGSIAKIITCFTLAHSVTLALATFNLVELPGRFIEPMIAASVVYVGLENIFRRGRPKGRWLLTLTFGLVHGFGFASVLREMDIARSGNIALPLVSFNLGVEAGQIAIAAIVLPVLWRLKRFPNFAVRWVPACSIFIAAAGAYWFIERVWF